MLRGLLFTMSLLVGLALGACARDGGPGSDFAFHPDETDPARSERARGNVLECAENRGWHLNDIELLVDDKGRLIKTAYRSRNIFPGTLEREVVDDCLFRADATQPPPNP